MSIKKEKEIMKSYHHGDLRNILIEKGIEYINKEGEEKFSLRKVASECGVSSAAPYTHFKDKNELLDAMSGHIINLLTVNLEKTAEKYRGREDMLAMLGKSYVMFFYNTPQYYSFIFSRKNIEVDLSLKVDDKDMNRPLSILKKEAVEAFGKAGFSEKVIQNKIIAMWALVQGLTSIAVMPNVKYEENWEEKIEEIIKSVIIKE